MCLAIIPHIVLSTEHWHEVLVHGVEEYLKIEMGKVRKRSPQIEYTSTW